MSTQNADLARRQCKPCEGGVEPLSGNELLALMLDVPFWSLVPNKKSIARRINAGTFAKALKLIDAIGEIAEDQQHHPDLHLTGYRDLRIVMKTHAIGGLSENDFIVAAKINELISDFDR